MRRNMKKRCRGSRRKSPLNCKLDPFTELVEQIHKQIAPMNDNSIKSNSTIDSSCDEAYSDSESPLRKRSKLTESEEEEKPPHVENGVLRIIDDVVHKGSSASITSTSTSSESSSRQIIEPNYDLTKSMLRDSYSAKSQRAREDKELARKAKEDTYKEAINNDETRCETGYETELQKTAGGSLNVRNNKNGGTRNKSNDGPLFKDLVGMIEVVKQLMLEVIVPFRDPDLPRILGTRPVGGILLHGPPGCGKTTLARAIANETGLPFYEVSSVELVSGGSGTSEGNIEDLFSKACKAAPSILFIDEIDAIAAKRENQNKITEQRIVIKLMQCMDNARRAQNGDSHAESSYYSFGSILVIGATNRPDALDHALRRSGRFDYEIAIGAPDETARFKILSTLIRKCRVETDVDLLKIARSTPGFVGSDLKGLINKAGTLATKRMMDQRELEVCLMNQAGTLATRRIIDQRELEASTKPEDEELGEWWWYPSSEKEKKILRITMADFEEAVKTSQPSTRREGFSSIPNVQWEDVGGLQSLRHEFYSHIVARIKDPESYKRLGVKSRTGFLLYGPPGCGKTLVAKAVAREAGATFIYIKGPELLNKYVGESESAVRIMFARARKCSPCILFFDEVDSLTTKRGLEGSWIVERVLDQLLEELDGEDQQTGVYVIGATNRPDVIDPAMLRHGRLGKLVYVPLPSPDERGSILIALARNMSVDASVDLMAIGRDNACKNFSGADLAALMESAGIMAITEAKEMGESAEIIKEIHIKRAMMGMTPSVSDQQIQFYERFHKGSMPRLETDSVLSDRRSYL